eukprot:6175901-Pleurochrysis_carterae.AAC.4
MLILPHLHAAYGWSYRPTNFSVRKGVHGTYKQACLLAHAAAFIGSSNELDTQLFWSEASEATWRSSRTGQMYHLRTHPSAAGYKYSPQGGTYLQQRVVVVASAHEESCKVRVRVVHPALVADPVRVVQPQPVEQVLSQERLHSEACRPGRHRTGDLQVERVV